MDIVLETERIALREFAESDADLLVELDSDPEVMRYLNGGRPTSREHIERTVLPRILDGYRRHPGFGIWAAFAGEFIGWFMLRPVDDAPPGTVEVGYRLRRAAWGKGYATEGSRALLHKGFTELGVTTIVAETMTVNTGSRRVMEKLGLSYVRTFHPEGAPIPGSEHGEVCYELTKEDWLASR